MGKRAMMKQGASCGRGEVCDDIAKTLMKYRRMKPRDYVKQRKRRNWLAYGLIGAFVGGVFIASYKQATSSNPPNP